MGLFHSKEIPKSRLTPFDAQEYIGRIDKVDWLSEEDKEKMVMLIKETALMKRRENDLVPKMRLVTMDIMSGRRSAELDEVFKEMSAIEGMRAHLAMEIATMEFKYAEAMKKSKKRGILHALFG